jgi:hypothetical protein
MWLIHQYPCSHSANKRWDIVIVIIIIVYAISFRLIFLDRAFHIDNEGISSFYAVLARNYLNPHWGENLGIPVLTVGHIPDVQTLYYYHHPPLVPLLIVPFYSLFGIGEWQTRLPTSVATVAAICLLFLLLRRFSTSRIALIGTALYAAIPMNLYFGGAPEVVYMPLTLFILLSLFAYLKFHNQPDRRTFSLLLFAFLLAALCDWPAYIIVPVFLIHFISTRPRYKWPWIFAFCIGTCVIFCLFYIYVILVTKVGWDWILRLSINRGPMSAIAPSIINEWLPKAIEYNRSRHTFPVLIAAFAWLVAIGWRLRQSQPGATIARILLAWGLLHVLVGYQGAYIHEWWWAPLTPGLIVASALALDWAISAAARHGHARLGLSAAVLSIALFAAWSTDTTFKELSADDHPVTLDLGQAIQMAAPKPNEIAMLAWTGYPPKLWFYGNRPLKFEIWSLDKFYLSLNDDWVDLPYCLYDQPWKGPCAGIVLPKNGNQDLEKLRIYLQKNYVQLTLPPSLADKFDIFRLTLLNAGVKCEKKPQR